jgi:hypothetical protein
MSYRIAFKAVFYTSSEHVSPARIEEQIKNLMAENHQAFGWVADLDVEKMEGEDDVAGAWEEAFNDQ